MKTTSSNLMSKMASAVFAVAVLLVLIPAKGDGIDLSIESVSGAPGSTGTFDVLLENTGGGTQNIAAFNFVLTTANTDITFNDVTTNTTTATYIFPSSFFGPDIVTPPTGGQTIEAGDVDATLLGTDVADGATYGLGSVSYSIAPGAVNGETAEIDFAAYPDTSLSDNDGNNVPFTNESGTISVQTSSSTVPEPATSWPLAAALLITAFFAHKRRRRAV